MLELQELEKRIGYQFKNRALLRRATTHRSFSADHNERLEFLGDSVLGCTIGSSNSIRTSAKGACRASGAISSAKRRSTKSRPMSVSAISS